MKSLPVSIVFGLLSKPNKHLCVCDANCFSFYFFGWVTVFINLQINICLFSWKLNDFIWSFVFPIAWLPYTFFYDEHMSLSSYHFGNHGVDSILLTIVSKSYKNIISWSYLFLWEIQMDPYFFFPYVFYCAPRFKM